MFHFNFILLVYIGLGSWWLMPLSKIFQLYRGQFWWRKPEYPDRMPVTDKLLSYNVVYNTPRHEQDLNSQLTSKVIGTDCIGSCKSSYHTTMTMTMTMTTTDLYITYHSNKLITVYLSILLNQKDHTFL